MNTTFEKSANTTDEWYTPKEIIDALGKFDLDPCAPVNPLWKTAEIMYNKNQDGLTKKWIGTGKKSGIKEPENEKIISTNFIR